MRINLVIGLLMVLVFYSCAILTKPMVAEPTHQFNKVQSLNCGNDNWQKEYHICQYDI